MVRMRLQSGDVVVIKKPACPTLRYNSVWVALSSEVDSSHVALKVFLSHVALFISTLQLRLSGLICLQR